MTYHLARVAEWYAHGNVRFYPTGIDRQLWQPPAGEYLVRAGYGFLGGRDWLANLPQWLAAAGSATACAWITGLLGGTRRTRLLAAVVAALVPALVLEGSSSQTDLLASLWLLIATALLVERYAERAGRRNALWFGAAIGLVVATKGTALPFGLPLVLAYVGRDLVRRDWSGGVLTLAARHPVERGHQPVAPLRNPVGRRQRGPHPGHRGAASRARSGRSGALSLLRRVPGSGLEHPRGSRREPVPRRPGRAGRGAGHRNLARSAAPGVVAVVTAVLSLAALPRSSGTRAGRSFRRRRGSKRPPPGAR
jgi:Dolichyl-phosphate-mannose-protein mannosyltransferase